MTQGELIEIDDRLARLDWMRAEFRAAQQRRYDRRYEESPTALTKTAPLANPESAPKPNPPTVITRHAEGHPLVI